MHERFHFAPLAFAVLVACISCGDGPPRASDFDAVPPKPKVDGSPAAPAPEAAAAPAVEDERTRVLNELAAANPDYNGLGIVEEREDGTWFVDFSKTGVADLSALAGQPIAELRLTGSPVANLDFLAGSPVINLHINDTSVNDLSVLKDLPVKRLVFTPDRVTSGMEMLRGKTSVVEIGTSFGTRTSPEYFWAMRDR